MGQAETMSPNDPTPDAFSRPPHEGDEAFSALAQRHRRELLVHCYRMLGSLNDAEDAVQETLLRAWRYRGGAEQGVSLRPWLYRVATNVCLDAIGRDGRRQALAAKAAAGTLRSDGEGGEGGGEVEEVSWLEPLPDALLEPAAPRSSEPEAALLTRETIELSFLTVIQLLTPQQRAALILRDLLGWSAKETAELLEVSVAAANSALQRARETLRDRFPARRPEWPPEVDATAAERELVERYVAAGERADLGAFEDLIREDAIFRMPPNPEIWVGREAILRGWAEGGFGSASFGRLRSITPRANLQPAVACYVLQAGDTEYRPLAIDVLRIEEGRIAEIVTFGADVFASFGLPATLRNGGEGKQ